MQVIQGQMQARHAHARSGYEFGLASADTCIQGLVPIEYAL